MLGMTTIWTTPCMMMTVIISTRTPYMVARLVRVVGEVVKAMGAVDSWRAHSWLLEWQGAAGGLKI